MTAPQGRQRHHRCAAVIGSLLERRRQTGAPVFQTDPELPDLDGRDRYQMRPCARQKASRPGVFPKFWKAAKVTLLPLARASRAPISASSKHAAAASISASTFPCPHAGEAGEGAERLQVEQHRGFADCRPIVPNCLPSRGLSAHGGCCNQDRMSPGPQSRNVVASSFAPATVSIRPGEAGRGCAARSYADR